jgi:hypothetical protein
MWSKLDLAFIIPMFVLVFFCSSLSRACCDDLSFKLTNGQYIEGVNNGIHFLPHDPSQGSETATAAIPLAAGQPWEVDFSLTMTPDHDAGMSLKLLNGSATICWVGAGYGYNKISGFLSGDTSNMPFNQPLDTNLHSFRFVSDGEILSLWQNGQCAGHVPQTVVPDTIQFASDGMDSTISSITLHSFDPPAESVPVTQLAGVGVAEVHRLFASRDKTIAGLQAQLNSDEKQFDYYYSQIPLSTESNGGPSPSTSGASVSASQMAAKDYKISNLLHKIAYYEALLPDFRTRLANYRTASAQSSQSSSQTLSNPATPAASPGSDLSRMVDIYTTNLSSIGFEETIATDSMSGANIEMQAGVSNDSPLLKNEKDMANEAEANYKDLMRACVTEYADILKMPKFVSRYSTGDYAFDPLKDDINDIPGASSLRIIKPLK